FSSGGNCRRIFRSKPGGNVRFCGIVLVSVAAPLWSAYLKRGRHLFTQGALQRSFFITPRSQVAEGVPILWTWNWEAGIWSNGFVVRSPQVICNGGRCGDARGYRRCARNRRPPGAPRHGWSSFAAEALRF